MQYPHDGSMLMNLMKNKLDAQHKIAWTEPIEINTTRVHREPHQLGGKQRAITRSWIEYLQNILDFMERATTHPDVQLTRDDNTLKWTLGGNTAVSVRSCEEYIDLTQRGLPLCLDSIGTGTVSKGAQGEGAGGFGDGAKTAAHALLYYGFRVQFFFFCFDSADPDAVLEWNWVVKHFTGFKEMHMGVEVKLSRRSEYKELTQPTMVTRVRSPGGGAEHMDLLREACVAALSHFQVLYRSVSDPKKLTVSADGFGSWRRTKTFEPLFDSFLGFPLSLPAGERCACLVLANGIFYEHPFEAFGATPELVVVVHGKGIPGSDFQIFNNQMREVDSNRLQAVFLAQFRAFADVDANREALVSIFKPLLKGGASFAVDQHRASKLVQSILYDHAACARLRKMLLFWKLSPKEWPLDPKALREERSDVQNRVECAVVADEYTYERVRFCEFLCGNVDNVLVVGSSADWRVFRPVAIHEEFAKAAAAAERDARGAKRLVRPVDRAFLPAVKYIAGDDVKVLRVHVDLPDGVEPFNFRTADERTIVICSIDNPEKVVGAFTPQMIVDADESKRGTQFFLHFVSNDARRMALGSRVKYAVRCAASDAPYDVGGGGKRKREESSSSESEEAEEKESVLAALRKKLAAAKKAKEEEKSADKTNDPLQKTPSIKTFAGGKARAAGPSAPEPESDTSEQKWDGAVGLFRSPAAPAQLPDEVTQTLRTFHRVVDIVRDKVNTGRVQIHASYTPEDTWRGLYYPGSQTAIINLYFCKSASKIMTVIVHELAHFDSGAHDVNHGRGMMNRFEAILQGFLVM